MYVGCSGGSVYASFMALNYGLEKSTELTLKFWNRRMTEKRHWLSLARVVLPGLFRFNERFGLIDDKRLWESLSKGFEGSDFADTHKPLRILATDFHTGEQVVISEGSLMDAIRASISIPYIWPAWQIGERLLMDGALSNPMPVDVAMKEGMDIILTMGFESPYSKNIKSLRRLAFHLQAIMNNNLLKTHFGFQSLAHHSEIIPVLPEFDRPINLFSTDQIPYVIEQGEREAEKHIPYLKKLLKEGGSG